MTSFRTLCFLFVSCGLALGAAGCDPLQCGDGTIEVDGRCALPDTVVDSTTCATGTRFDATAGACVPDVNCGPNTVAEQNPDGSIICVGTGGVGGCEGPMPQCRPSADTSFDATVCGTLTDIATGDLLRDGDTPVLCDQANPTPTGPCSVQVRAFDPLQFAANPDGTPPLDVQVFQDTCGRYAITDVEVPFNGFIAVSTTDVYEPGENEGPTVTNNYRQTGTTISLRVGTVRDDIEAAVTETETDLAWTTSAGCPFNEAGGDGDPCLPANEIQTFADVGVFVPLYVVPNTGVPASGVTITANGQVLADLDYYFSDTATDSRTTIDPALDATGANGTGLLTPTALRDHSGQGGEPNGCEWSTDLAASIPNVVFFQPKLAHVLDNPMDFDCPQ